MIDYSDGSRGDGGLADNRRSDYIVVYPDGWTPMQPLYDLTISSSSPDGRRGVSRN